MRSARVDLYGVLGVARSVTVAELRHAYRKLALAHHPDRAGAASATVFAGIADAYRVLSNPVARSAYDASLAEEAAWSGRATGAVHAGGIDWAVSTQSTQKWQATRPVHIPDLLPRVSGDINQLAMSRIASVTTDGIIELHLTAAEAAAGGTAAIRMPLKVVCSSCGGVARPRGVWCRICQHDGRIEEEVTVLIRVSSYTHPGSVLTISVPRAMDSPLRIRFFVHGLRPHKGTEG